MDRVLLEDRDALGAALALRPELERLAPEARRVAMRVDRDAAGDRLEQRVERARAVARGEPVRRDLGAIVIAVRAAPPARRRWSARRRSHGTSS